MRKQFEFKAFCHLWLDVLQNPFKIKPDTTPVFFRAKYSIESPSYLQLQRLPSAGEGSWLSWTLLLSLLVMGYLGQYSCLHTKACQKLRYPRSCVAGSLHIVWNEDLPGISWVWTELEASLVCPRNCSLRGINERRTSPSHLNCRMYV